MSPTSTPGKPARVATPAVRLRTRRWWLKVHRWLGLSLGIVLLVAAATGSAMLIADPLDKALNAPLFRAPNASKVDYPTVVTRLKEDTGPGASLTLRPPRSEGETLQANVRGGWSGTIFMDPATGEVLGHRAESGTVVGFLFTLHSSLLGGETGKAVLTLAAFAYVLMLVSGIYLWWPVRWSQAFTIRWTASKLRTWFDWHRVTGAVLGMLVLISVVSGAYMAWPPLAQSVTKLSGASLASPPAVVGGPPQAEAIGRAVDMALTAFPQAMVGYVQVPAKAHQPIRVRLRLPDDPHPNGLTSVWLHPDTTQILQINRWSELDPGTRAYAYIYPLHTGELWGWVWTVLTFFIGIALSAYAITGLWIWWRRR